MDERDDRPSALSLHAALAAVQVAFASLSVVGKMLVGSLDPSALALLRLALAFVVFAALAARSMPRVPPKDVLGIAGCAALGIFGNQMLFLHGLRLTTAVHATVLVALIPVFTTLVAVCLGRERPSPRAWAGIGVAFCGVLVLVGGEAVLARGPAIGDALIVANSLSYAAFLVLVKHYVARYGGLVVVAIGFGFGTLFALPFGAPALLASWRGLSLEQWALVAYVVLVATVFTYLTNAWALAHASSSVVAIYIYLQPAVASLLAWIFLDEVLTERVLAGAALVLGGVTLVTLGRTKPARAEAASP